MLRNYVLAAAEFDSTWLEPDAVGPFVLNAGSDTGLVIRATAPGSSDEGGSFAARLLYVGNAVGSGMQSIEVSGEIGVYSVISSPAPASAASTTPRAWASWNAERVFAPR